MNQEIREYIHSLIPEGFPDGNKLVEEGRRMAADIPWNKNRFLRENGYETWEQYSLECHKAGKPVFNILMGLSSLEEEVEAIKTIEGFFEESGIEARSVQAIASSLVGLPPEYRENAPKPTSYMMESPEDWAAQGEAAAVDICWEDWHLSSPNNLEETRNALAAGTSRLGCFSQLIWDYPGWYDEKKRFSDMCRSMGILARYRDQGMRITTYPEDGVAGYFMDVASMLGYVMLEHYIIEDLCGARMTLSYGGLLPEILPRMAFGMACETLYGKKDQPVLLSYNGSTNTQWDHDIEANYGIGALEMLIQECINRKYDYAVPHKPVSITEALRVPTLEELLNIVRCGSGAMTRTDEWMEIIDFTKFENMRDLLIEKGTAFYRNFMNGFAEAGVNIKDPMELIVVLKRIDPIRMEMAFHPSTEEYGSYRPYVASSLYRQTMRVKEEELKKLKEHGFEGSMQNKKVICASADGHSYGLLLITHLWEDLGADVVNGGVNMEPAAVLDLADEEGTDRIAVSLHCGQSLDYAKQIIEAALSRGRSYRICMGGVLNAMVPGHTEPIDVADRIRAMGICASNSFEEQIQMFTYSANERNKQFERRSS